MLTSSWELVQETKSPSMAVCSNYRIAQENGQRIFGPPLDCQHYLPERGSEVFVGKIPRDCFEKELIPLFERPGKIFKMRLMIDFSGKNRGYGFVQYFTREDAKRAVQLLNGFEVRKNWCIGVMPSKNNNRLFFGNLPNNITRNEMVSEIAKYTSGIKSAIYYGGPHRTNGFGFVEYENHKMTALARRKFFPGSILLFDRQPKVDWAKSEEDIEDDDALVNKSILYVRFFKVSTSEEEIKQFFSCTYNGRTLSVQRVKKIRNFAFVHYFNSIDAQIAFQYFQGVDLSRTSLNEPDQELEIKWAKNRPSSPVDSVSSPAQSSDFQGEEDATPCNHVSSVLLELNQALLTGTQQPEPHTNECFVFNLYDIQSNMQIKANQSEQNGCANTSIDQFSPNYDSFIYNNFSNLNIIST